MGRSDGKEGQGKVIKVMKDADSKDSLSVVVTDNIGETGNDDEEGRGPTGNKVTKDAISTKDSFSDVTDSSGKTGNDGDDGQGKVIKIMKDTDSQDRLQCRDDRQQ